jgi:hypothetical protein
VIAQTLVLMALLAIFATSAVSGVAAVAREQNASAARALVVPGVETALGIYERYVAATIAAQAAAGGSGPDRAVDLQCSAFVQESRLSLQITSDTGPADANGLVSPLAHGRFIVTLRLFAQPPYAIVSGAKDAAGPDDAHEGDDAGWGGAIAAFASPPPDDTTIHVVYACSPGTGSCATSNPVPQDAPTTIPWTDGNGVP